MDKRDSMILKQIDGFEIDLSFSEKFVAHYNNPATFAKHIIDTEINTGLWYDEIFETLPFDAVIIDAGANCGLWTVYMQPKAKEIICIEPSPEAFSVLESVANPLQCLFAPTALWKHTGYVQLNEVADNTTCNKVQDGTGTSCITLLDFLTLNNIDHVDLLKLDIEGVEQQVILEDPTSGEALKRCRIVYIEVHPPPYGNADEQGVIGKMKSLGFTHHPAARGWAHFFVNGN